MLHFYRILSDSPNMRKISLAMDYLDLPYKSIVIDTYDETQSQQLRAISPAGFLPALVDEQNGVNLFESGAILFYLAEKSGQLLPKQVAQRAEVMKWVFFEAANLSPAVTELHHYIMHDDGSLPVSVCAQYQQRLASCCAILNQQCGNGEYLAGELSIADFALFPWASALEDLAEVSFMDFPHLQQWLQRMDYLLRAK